MIGMLINPADNRRQISKFDIERQNVFVHQNRENNLVDMSDFPLQERRIIEGSSGVELIRRNAIRRISRSISRINSTWGTQCRLICHFCYQNKNCQLGAACFFINFHGPNGTNYHY